MSAVSLDFERLLGYKLMVRASRLAVQGDTGSLSKQSSESGPMESYAAILHAKVGLKPVIGLRYRVA
jgi:hypothetical protein